MPRAMIESSAPSPRAALWLVVPLAAAPLGALGWVQADRLRSAGATDDPTLAVAVLAAGTCLAVAGWWIGGLAMLYVAAVARRLHWAGLERWATRLTPGLVARTTAAAVGIQLAVLAPAPIVHEEVADTSAGRQGSERGDRDDGRKRDKDRNRDRSDGGEPCQGPLRCGRRWR